MIASSAMMSRFFQAKKVMAAPASRRTAPPIRIIVKPKELGRANKITAKTIVATISIIRIMRKKGKKRQNKNARPLMERASQFGLRQRPKGRG